jgi:hypothetical protein
MAHAPQKTVCLLALLTAGCAQYLVVAAQPRYAGQPHIRTQASIAGGTAVSPPQIVARDCGPHEQLAMVIVRRDFGQGLLSFLTLGMYAPATVEYRCASEPPTVGDEINTSGGE